ncbi:MAG: hypothetical protein ABGZ53_30860, partial [Fuerstiella sp.]
HRNGALYACLTLGHFGSKLHRSNDGDQPDCLWAGTIPGGLFRSSDGGKTWAFNEPLWQREERVDWFGGGKDDPGIHSVCVDPRDSRHVTLGVSCGGVWETDDAGDSWALIGEGMRADFMPPDAQFKKSIQDAHRLAQENCYDIVFRHGLDTDDTGRQLAMGSSTGGLWISENDGDDWCTVSNMLPQIYVVRFSRRS